MRTLLTLKLSFQKKMLYNVAFARLNAFQWQKISSKEATNHHKVWESAVYNLKSKREFHSNQKKKLWQGTVKLTFLKDARLHPILPKNLKSMGCCIKMIKVGNKRCNSVGNKSQSNSLHISFISSKPLIILWQSSHTIKTNPSE